MRVIKYDSRVKELLERKKNVNLNISGFLQNYPDAQIYCGKDIDGGIIVKRDNDNFFAQVTDDDLIDEFLYSLPSGKKQLCGVEKSVAERIEKRIIKLGYECQWRTRCDAYVLTGAFERGDDKGYKCIPLTPNDAQEVDKYYTYKSDASIYRILDNINNRDSSCIWIDGELACWSTVHFDNSMGILYVKEKYRGLQLGRIVTEDLIIKLLAKNIIPYVHIVDDNINSHNLIVKLKGMELSHVCDWLGIIKP